MLGRQRGVAGLEREQPADQPAAAVGLGAVDERRRVVQPALPEAQLCQGRQQAPLPALVAGPEVVEAVLDRGGRVAPETTSDQQRDDRAPPEHGHGAALGCSRARDDTREPDRRPSVVAHVGAGSEQRAPCACDSERVGRVAQADPHGGLLEEAERRLDLAEREQRLSLRYEREDLEIAGGLDERDGAGATGEAECDLRVFVDDQGRLADVAEGTIGGRRAAFGEERTGAVEPGPREGGLASDDRDVPREAHCDAGRGEGVQLVLVEAEERLAGRERARPVVEPPAGEREPFEAWHRPLEPAPGGQEHLGTLPVSPLDRLEPAPRRRRFSHSA